MPKASSSTELSFISPAHSILKRNQACHQCRRRKLKCDAQRPCATCIRSHAKARMTSGMVSIPPEPKCTYDEIPEPSRSNHDAPKGRYERLESRINELEDLLKQSHHPAYPAEVTDAPDPKPLGSNHPVPDTITRPYAPSEMPLSHTSATSKTLSTTEPQYFSVIDNGSPDVVPARPAPQSTSSYDFDPERSTYGSRNPSPPTAANSDSPKQHVDFLQKLFWPSWPARLPNPEMLMHLVDIFFASLPHANRILHRPSFITKLSLNPTDPSFPASSILHAICAVASLFSPVVVPPPLPNLNEQAADEIFPEKHRRIEPRDDTFGEMHAKYAKEAQAEAAMLGDGIFAGTQSVVILSWYYFYHARWADVWMSTGEALRYCTPLSLNVCWPQMPLTRSWQADRPILAQPSTIIEEETRRNTFWLAYAMDRFHSSGTDFAMMLDDEDVSQVLPCTLCAFGAGTSVPVEQRQRLNTPGMLTTHPPEHTDSFVLYIKAALLLSKVKIFNQRFRVKYPGPGSQDPRETPAFKALDSVIGAFSDAFPREFRDPLANAVDSHLYVAHLAPHTAMLVLHSPHADFTKRDSSYEKLTAAAHAILDLVCLVCATSCDIMLLDPIVVWCWHWAARELVREMLHMQQTGHVAEVAVLRSEVEVIRLALERLGERIPLGYRQTKILDDLLAQEVPAYAQWSTISEFEEVNPGSLEHLMYEGMHWLW